MIKKVVTVIGGIVLAGVFVVASSVETKAALPCTYDIINDANGNIAANTAGYEQAKATEAAMLAALNAVKANPAHSQLEYEQAAFNYANAVNVSQWWLGQINNSKEYLKNITGRGQFEDKFWANKAALANLTTIQAAKTDADGAANIAAGVAKQIADVEAAIAGYKVLVVSNPSFQPQIDSLTAQLAALKADYAAKAAIASEKAALFNTYLNTLDYKSYSKGFEDYQFQREYFRDKDDWDPKGKFDY